MSEFDLRGISGIHLVRICQSLSAACIVAWSPGHSAFAQTEQTIVSEPASVELPENVRLILEENASALTPLSLKYKVQYRSDLSKQQVVKVGQFAEGWDFFEPIHVDLQRDGVKFSSRRQTWRTNNDSRGEWVSFCKFDGQDFYTIKNDPGGFPSVMVLPLEQLESRVWCDMEFVERAGFKRYDRPAPDRSLLLHYRRHEHRVTRAESIEVDGMIVLLVELVGPKHTHRFALDPALRYAVRTYETVTDKGSPVRRTVNTDFVEYQDPPIWLPHRSSTVWHTWSSMGSRRTDKPLVYEEIVVEDLSKAPLSDEVFVYELQTPLQFVGDARLPGAEKHGQGVVWYQVPANLDHLEGVIDAAVEGRRYEPPLTSQRTRLLLIVVNGLILAGAGLWFWLRRS